MSATTNTAPDLLTDERLIACIRSAAGPAVPMGLLRDRGPYEVTEPTLFARNLASLIEREVRAALAQQPAVAAHACAATGVVDHGAAAPAAAQPEPLTAEQVRAVKDAVCDWREDCDTWEALEIALHDIGAAAPAGEQKP